MYYYSTRILEYSIITLPKVVYIKVPILIKTGKFVTFIIILILNGFLTKQYRDGADKTLKSFFTYLGIDQIQVDCKFSYIVVLSKPKIYVLNFTNITHRTVLTRNW